MRDYSTGGRLSGGVLKNCSENVEGRSILHMILVEGGTAVKHTFWQGFAASHTEHVSSLMILPFLDTKRCENLAHKISSGKYLAI